MDVPSVGRDQAAALVNPEPNGAAQKSAANIGEATHEREERGSRLWPPPQWVGWVDWLSTKARGTVFPTALLAAALFAVWFAREMAESGKPREQKVPPSAAQPAPQLDKQDAEKSPSPWLTLPTRRPTVAVTLPDLAAPAPAAAGWMQWTASMLIAVVLLLAFYFVLLQPLDYNSIDSPAFSRAIEIWTPFLLTKLATPRALKRFQNQLRFRAMALAAQDAPGLDTSKIVGPIGRYLAAREQAKLEPDQRSDKLRPEPILVALESLREVIPELDVTQRDNGASLQSAIMIHRLTVKKFENTTAFKEAFDEAIRQHADEIESGRWPNDYKWPPRDDYYAVYRNSFDPGPRPA